MGNMNTPYRCVGANTRGGRQRTLDQFTGHCHLPDVLWFLSWLRLHRSLSAERFAVDKWQDLAFSRPYTFAL